MKTTPSKHTLPTIPYWLIKASCCNRHGAFFIQKYRIAPAEYKNGSYKTGGEKSPPLIHFEDMEGIGERCARDAVTGERYKLPKDTAYKQWKEMQDAAHGAEAVDKMRKMSYNESADKAQFERYKNLFGAEFPKTFEAFQKLKYGTPDVWEDFKARARTKNYLQEQLAYVWNGEKCFLPKNAHFDAVVTMAGYGAKDPIRIVDRLISDYGGAVDDWRKRAGRITSDKYIFDVHWYEKDGVQYEPKLKNRKERKK